MPELAACLVSDSPRLILDRHESQRSHIPVTVRETAGLDRRQEIVRLGVPLARGTLRPGESACVVEPGGNPIASQVAPLATWPDGSVQWLDVAFIAQVAGKESKTYLVVPGQPAAAMATPLDASQQAEAIVVDSGEVRFRLPRRGNRLIDRVMADDEDLFSGDGAQLTLRDARGERRTLVLDNVELASAGPLCARVAFSGRFPRLALCVSGLWTFSAGSALATLELTLHNPQRARHRGGQWDLGDPGSVCFTSLHIDVPLARQAGRCRWRTASREPWSEQSAGTLEIVQHSSGGEAFDSRSHVDRHGQVPQSQRGYTVHSAAGERAGLRADPVVAVRAGRQWLAAGIHEFWQQFPKSLELAADTLRVGVFPAGTEPVELQGGEQKTTRIGLVLGARDETAAGDVAEVTAPLAVVWDHASLVATAAVPRLPKSAAALRTAWRRVATGALVGPRSLFAKREAIDEYGWRNFGDLWADHEEAYYDGPRPIVSHYNNQYDALEAFLLCYLLTGDPRWWALADPLARHTIDIDIYRTTEDRAAYNGGLFWHTNHYVAAGTATHRAYSRASGPAGGGPSSEHNYTSGLLLYWQLTGNPQARETVIGLAQWVLNMDDGQGHVLGLLSDLPTGLASQTTQATYHGPGRGAGNSINALLDGWLASGRRDFLAKVDQLVRRTVHPQEELPALQLDNAELRWSYTVCLQALVRLVRLADESDFRACLGQDLAEYARQSLLHYARWMAGCEKFYLDEPQQLEYPTETWAAQELRKANVLVAAADEADAHDKREFLAKAQWLYERAWSSLMSFPTWHYTRPTVLALQLGLTEAQLALSGPREKPQPSGRQSATWPRAAFVPQREVVRRQLRSPARVAAMASRLLRVWRWPAPWRRTWAAHCLRRGWSIWRGK